LQQGKSLHYIGFVRQFCHRTFHDPYISVERTMQTAAVTNKSANHTLKGLVRETPENNGPEGTAETEQDYCSDRTRKAT